MQTFLIFILLGLVAFLAWRVWSLSQGELPITPLEKTSPPNSPSEISAPDHSLRDGVTGLYNHKHLLHRLSECVARADREGKTMAVVLWDIDGFVKFNNQYGQKEGDKFLQKVAGLVRKSLRVYDEAFRSGPDEFCALLLPADQGIAQEVTQRVSQMVSKDLFEGEGEYAGRAFSISSGCVFYPGPSKVPEAILHAVQQALYKSRLENARAN